MNVISLEFNFADFAFVTYMLQCTATMIAWYLILLRQFIHEIHKINPTLNLRLLQYLHCILGHTSFKIKCGGENRTNLSHMSLQMK